MCVSDNEKTNSVETETEKKPWVTPTATAEQVSEVTKTNLGGGADAVTCHS